MPTSVVVVIVTVVVVGVVVVGTDVVVGTVVVVEVDEAIVVATGADEVDDSGASAWSGTESAGDVVVWSSTAKHPVTTTAIRAIDPIRARLVIATPVELLSFHQDTIGFESQGLFLVGCRPPSGGSGKGSAGIRGSEDRLTHCAELNASWVGGPSDPLRRPRGGTSP